MLLENLIEQGPIFSPDIKGGEYTLPSFIETEELYRYMKKYNIKPIKTNWIVTTSEYEDLLPSALFFKKDNISSNSVSYIFYRNVKNYNLDIMILVFIPFLFLYGYVLEKDRGNQIGLIFSQPIKRDKYNMKKHISQAFILVFALIIVFVFYFLYALLTDGIGDFNQPIIFYDKLVDTNLISKINKDYFSLIPIWKYNISLFFYLALQLIFISSIGLFTSIFVKERKYVFASTLIIIVLGIFFSQYLPDYIKVYSPFIHLKAGDIVNGAIRIKNKLINYKFYHSIISLISSTLLTYFASCFIIKRKDVV